MSAGLWVLAGVLAAYGLFVLALVARGSDAQAWARFIPDCVRLVARLLRDPRVPRRHRIALWLLAAYLASPIDLVPDFIPVAGQLDDAILLGLVLRRTVRAAGRETLGEHWPGPPATLRAVERLCGLAVANTRSVRTPR